MILTKLSSRNPITFVLCGLKAMEAYVCFGTYCKVCKELKGLFSPDDVQ